MTGSGLEIIARCRDIARFSESTSGITRTFLCPAMRDVHGYLRDWMHQLGIEAWVDAIGNLRGLYGGREKGDGPRLLIGSHLDTVPDAGAYDGVLGVMVALALIESLQGERLPLDIEVVAFSEEEGVRFGLPFLGSRAMVGRIDAPLLGITDAHGITLGRALRDFGLDPDELPSAILHPRTFAYLEFHIEQGPVLDEARKPLGIVEAIAGQSRYRVTFEGTANHAGTTPMHLRRDALAGAAEWVGVVENIGRTTNGLVATVSALESHPQAGNVIAGRVTSRLDARHASDAIRREAVQQILDRGVEVARARELTFHAEPVSTQQAVPMHRSLITALESAALIAGYDAPRMVSGAGHDAMIMAEKVPSGMIFLRTPNGVSHHPDETVRAEDIAAAIATGLQFLDALAKDSKL